jgi:hypothetical protein
MPNTITQYECTRCLFLYDTEQEAMDCEDAHLLPMSVVGQTWRRDDNTAAYPASVSIAFPTGGPITYIKAV